jgi:Glycosyl hydrolases family 35
VDFTTILGNIFAVNGSVNFYMFHGGTNFGYMNGANILGTGRTPLLHSVIIQSL